jgi:UDP:flavonoid glycosyltransferase YjiC (YdhE family)
MRILITTRGSSGHLIPLAPLGHACVDAGHEVLVAAQDQHRANVERVGLPFAPVGDPPSDEWMPLMSEFAELDLDTANQRMIGDFFAGIDTRAALPALTEIVQSWKPDLVVRESWEYGSTIAAELHEIPIARVGLGLTSMEELSIEVAAPTVDRIRRTNGLEPDPAGHRLRASHYFTLIPEAIDPAIGRLAPIVHRFREPAPETLPPLPDLWPADNDPLVYLTFGSVAAGAHLPYFPELYRAAIEALAELPVRLLVTIGNDRDPEELDARGLPLNVRVERWVAQEAISARAAAIVCHGGYGTTVHALTHGVPLVVMPLFSSDQWANAEAVAAAGAGLALDSERRSRRVLDLPAPDTLSALRPAVERVLSEPRFAREAERVAASAAALPPIEEAPRALERLAESRATPPHPPSLGA